MRGATEWRRAVPASCSRLSRRWDSARRARRSSRQRLLPIDARVRADVKQFVSICEQKNEFPLPQIDRAGLHLTRPTAKYLLAMKVMSSRKPLPGYRGDLDDIARLLRITKMKTVGQVEAVVESFFPNSVLPDSTLLKLDELLASTKRS